jgi:hypothetical protein
MEKLDSIIFYTIDKTIRSYRNYTQRQLKANGFTITIDHWLTLSYKYNFGSEKSGQPGRTGSADDLKQRIGNG